MANNDKLIRIDGIKWWEPEAPTNKRVVVPICPQHNLRLTVVSALSPALVCPENDHTFTLPRPYIRESNYVLNRIDSQAFARMPVLNLDDEAIPVAKEELQDTDYWVKAKVTKSKSGVRLIVWAGDKSKKNKAQLFVEPSLKRMTFDQNDVHPLEVFTRVEATFVDGAKTIIKDN
jgi:hypothetical protein